MQNQLQKAINLAKKTGDRLLVFDFKYSDSAYVVMSLDEYEKLAIGRNEVRNLTEDELLDKINRDIAVWKSEQNYQENEDKNFKNFAWDEPAERFEFPGHLTAGHREETKPKINKSHWRIPQERKIAAEEIIEEDRQYLEDI